MKDSDLFFLVTMMGLFTLAPLWFSYILMMVCGIASLIAMRREKNE